MAGGDLCDGAGRSRPAILALALHASGIVAYLMGRHADAPRGLHGQASLLDRRALILRENAPLPADRRPADPTVVRDRSRSTGAEQA